MQSTASRNSVPSQHRRVFIGYIGTVTLAGATVAAVTLSALPRSLLTAPVVFWLMAGLAVVADSLSFSPPGAPRHHHQQRSTGLCPSVCLSFAILLLWGLVPAVLVTLAAGLATCWRLRAAAWRTGFNLAQHTLSFGAAALVLARLGGIDGLEPASRPGWQSVGAMVLAAVAWFLTNYLLVCTAVWLRFGGGWWATLLSRIGYEALVTGALLLLAPILVAAVRSSAWLVALIMVPLYAVYRTARFALEQERSALTDPLTGLANRKGVRRRVDELLAAAPDRSRDAVAGTAAECGPVLMVLDLDRFKEVNDALGHAVGDRLLREVGRRLADGLPDDVLVARLGGDEFAVVLTAAADPAAARAFAEQVSAVLAGPVYLDGMPLEVASSIGIAISPQHGTDFDELLRHADVAMYEAKSRNDPVALYAPEADHNSAARLGLLGDLRRVLERPDQPDLGELDVFYQPQIEIASGRVVGVEALLRWRHPEHGMVGPEGVIRAAEHTPVMRLLTYWVVAEVAAQLGRWAADGIQLRAAINVSVRDLHHPELVDHLAAELDRHGVPPDRIEVEITEGALMADPRRVLGTLRQLHLLGVALSLDDFGTGYSSMLHLRRLPLAEVKIDRSFVVGMADDGDDAAIVRSIIELADALGLRVVAEGVENEPTWRKLAALGCQVAQGWFYARPMPAAELSDWLARYRPAPAPARGVPGRDQVAPDAARV